MEPWIAYLLIVACGAVWTLVVPRGKRIPEQAMRSITIFGGAFLLAVCCLDLLPELSGMPNHLSPTLPYVAILGGFLIQQVLDALSAHAEHGHTEEGFTLGGLMLGLSIHAFLEGMPLVSQTHEVDSGLLWGIIIHNIPVALILCSLMADRGYSLWRTLLVLIIFGIMSPVGSMLNVYAIQSNDAWQGIITGVVVGVLLHVSSSILFDHRRNHFSWYTVSLMVAAFAVAYIII